MAPNRVNRFLSHPWVRPVLTPRLYAERKRQALDRISELRNLSDFTGFRKFGETLLDWFAPGQQWNERELPDRVPFEIRNAFHDGWARALLSHAMKNPQSIDTLFHAIHLYRSLGMTEHESAAWNHFMKSAWLQTGPHRVWWISGGFHSLESSPISRKQKEELMERLSAEHHCIITRERHLPALLYSSSGIRFLLNDLEIQQSAGSVQRQTEALRRLWRAVGSTSLEPDARKELVGLCLTAIRRISEKSIKKGPWIRAFQDLLKPRKR